MKQLELSELLLRKTSADEYAAGRLLCDPNAADEVVGFHVQQAIEKNLKALLAAQGLPFRRTHDLAELIDLLREAGFSIPEEVEEARHFTPFAAEYRYGGFDTEDEPPLDRPKARDRLCAVRAWVKGHLDALR